MPYKVPELREVPPWLRRDHQATRAVADLLLRQKEALAVAKRETEQARKQAEDMAKVFGLALYRKRSAPNTAPFRTLFDALQTLDIELVAHVGELFEGDLEELADVVEWIDPTEEIAPGSVGEAFEPEIRLRGRLIHRAKLVCALDEPAVRELPAPGPQPSTDDQEGTDPSSV